MRLPTFAIVVVLLGVTVVCFRRAIPLTAWVLIGTALGMWALAHLLLFKLYMPSRYLIYARPVFAMMWAAVLAHEVVRHVSWVAQRKRLVQWIGPATYLVGAASILFAMVRYVGPTVAKYHAASDAPAEMEPVFDAIRLLPKDAVIAAHPDDANAIPLRTRHSVLVNTELSVAMNRNYYAMQKARLEATFAMLYADDWDAIDAVAAQNNVSYFLIRRKRLTNPEAYWQPFGTQNAAAIARGNFAMLDPPDHRIVFVGDDVTLVRVGAQ